MSNDKPDLTSVPELSDDRPEEPLPPEYTEEIEQPLSGKDQDDLEALNAEAPSYHTLLEVWLNLLAPAHEEQTQRVQPGWASRITSMYPQVKIQHMTEFRDRYFGKILELKLILDAEIEDDPDALQFNSAVADVEENSYHYRNLLLNWQKAILQWELDWDCEDDLAAVELGAISEVHKMFFGETGVTAYLDNIGFGKVFDEDDQRTITESLNEMREGQ